MKNKNITITLTKETEKMLEILKNDYMINASAMFRKMIKMEYEKLTNE